MNAQARTFRGIDPATGRELSGDFTIASADDVTQACRLAAQAAQAFRDSVPELRATLLETIAANLEARGEDLIARASAESGLTRPRLTGELGRTAGQLRLFARVVREGAWAGVTFDEPLPERQPLPRPDLRGRRVALGPVAVFGASNFPLAFSVAGGDTASALAAGCPVVVKGHPAHPGTSQLAADAIAAAVAACGLPAGVFAHVAGPANELGAQLVADPRIKAVGFTGSRAGGLALLAIAGARPEPIPVYAEMSSVNPAVLFPAALAARAESIAQSYVASLTLGAGQFCTNPGVVFALAGPDLDRFVAAAATALRAVAPQVMLTPAIHANYGRSVAALDASAGVQLVARGQAGSGCDLGQAALYITDAQSFRNQPQLAHEVFGAAGVIVRCAGLAEVAACIEGMEGQLTATVHVEPADYPAARALIPLLETKAGRILANGWPTGVEVSRAMVHGGPFPATSDTRTTSVGTAAIERFLRPVCYQALPDALLPPAVQDANPWSLPRAIFA